jgi:hypothetical protein
LEAADVAPATVSVTFAGALGTLEVAALAACTVLDTAEVTGAVAVGAGVLGAEGTGSASARAPPAWAPNAPMTAAISRVRSRQEGSAAAESTRQHRCARAERSYTAAPKNTL